MNHLRSIFAFFVLSFLLLAGAIGHSGCANIVPPTGGPRDTLPPRLIYVTPGDSARHFNTNKIVFTFDEYIDPKDIPTELIVSPLPKVLPIVDSKLRTLTVKIKDTLQPNTTYSLDFGKSVRDYNEGNILKNFRYVFSTGDHIDQGTFGGNVTIAVNGKTDSTFIVMLHPVFTSGAGLKGNDSAVFKDGDSAVAKDRPRYITRVDNAGQFQFENIAPGTYTVYALKDEGSQRKYLSKAQLFAFADSPIVVTQDTRPLSMFAYAEGEDKKPSSGSGAKSGSGTTPAAPTRKTAKDREKDRRLQMQSNTANNVFDVLDTFRLTFATGLKTFDSAQLRFTDENFKDVDDRRYKYVRDTTNKIVSLYFSWPTDTKYNLIIPKTFGQDSAGRKLIKDDTISFRTKKDIEYGEIRIRVPNINMSRKPVLQLIQGDNLKYAFAFSPRRDVRKILFPPGEYEMRILYDLNGNLRWDPGNYFGVKRQPEKVTPIKKKLTVKANWDNDVDITL